MSANRFILHVDMDAFFAQVEQRVNPSLKGLPVFVVGRPGKARTVVTAASYEAKKFGVKSGMSLPDALALCPNAVRVPADTSRYVDVSDKIYESLLVYSPQVEAASVDEFYIDATETAARWGGPVAMARDIKDRILREQDLTCSVGVAPNKLLAKWVAGRDKPDGLSVLTPEDVPRELERLPVGELYGVGPELRGKLRALGVLTCGEMGRHPVGELVAHFGVWGYRLSAMGRGLDDAPVAFSADAHDAKSVGHTQTIPYDAKGQEALHSWLMLQCERVAARLRRYNLAGHVVTLVLRDSSFVGWSRQRRYSGPTQDAAEIFQRAWKLFPEQCRKHSFRLVGVSVSDLAPSLQLPLTIEDQKRRRLLEAQDNINRRFGEYTILSARAIAAR